MKKVIIDRKEYWQQEECDIPKISMPIDKDILTKYQPERSKREDSVSYNIPEHGSESSLNFEE